MSKDSGSEVYSWGQGVLGQLGHSDEKTQRQPRLVVPFLGVHVKQVSCGNQHSAVLLESGEIFTFGRGNFGQLGQGTSVTANVSTPAIVAGLQGKAVKMIACGWHHTCALLDNGQLFTWGSGEYGRLGHGDETRQASPKLVEALQGKAVTFVAAGGFHTACILDGGSLYTWGGGYFGQLGHGDEADRKAPKVVKGLQHCVAHSVSCGTHHTILLTDKQEVWTWGSGEFGKLGIGDDEKHTEPVLIPALQSVAVTEVAAAGARRSRHYAGLRRATRTVGSFPPAYPPRPCRLRRRGRARSPRAQIPPRFSAHVRRSLCFPTAILSPPSFPPSLSPFPSPPLPPPSISLPPPDGGREGDGRREGGG